MAPMKGRTNIKAAMNDPEDPNYQEKRKRNNLAVMKSRLKAKNKTMEMTEKVNNLRSENSALQKQIISLEKDLDRLKEVFIDQAGASQPSMTVEQLNKLLEDTTDLPLNEAVKKLVNKPDL